MREPINIETDDNKLIDAFIEGNENAFNYIVLKYQKKVYRIIRRIVLNHDDTNDILQEVFIKLYNSMSEYRRESRFFTYLYRIAVNHSLNHIRKAKKNKAYIVQINDDIHDLSSTNPGIEEELEKKEKIKIVEKALKSLPEKQRLVFILRFYDNLSYEEIGEILNISKGGLKANYFHAVKKIQKIITDERQ